MSGTVVCSVAEIATPHASRYLTQVCKHFQHKCPVSMQDGSGEITFTFGRCSLRAGESVLTLSLQATDDSGMAQLQDVVARHLLRFAFREDLRIGWAVGSPAD